MKQLNRSRRDIAEMLCASGIYPTQQRVAIARALFSRQEHLSADRILAMVNKHDASTSKATVYNTLNLFLEKNLIRQVIVDPNKVFYDPNPSHHHHFYDIDSGELTDIHADEITVAGLPVLPEGVVTERVDVIVRIQRAKPLV